MRFALLLVPFLLVGCGSSHQMPPPGPHDGPPTYTPPSGPPNVTGTMGRRPFHAVSALARQNPNGSGGGDAIVMVFERAVRCEEWHLYAAPPPNPFGLGEHGIEITFRSLWPVFQGAQFKGYPLASNGTIDGKRPWDVLIGLHEGEHYWWVNGDVTVVAATQTGGTLQFQAHRSASDPNSPASNDPTFEGSVGGTVPFSVCPPDPFPTK